MAANKPSFRLRVARALLGTKTKDFIQALSPLDGWSLNGTGRLKQYYDKASQMSANAGWCFAANTAIVDPTAAVELKLYHKMKNGDREEVHEHEILQLFDNPNNVHTGEQLKQLHFTYLNFTGESYIWMIRHGDSFIPTRGQLPDALQIFPSHQVQFHVGKKYSKSIVKYMKTDYPVTAFIRDINPDPNNPYFGRSIIAAAAAAIDTEGQMVEWNRRLFANAGRPSMVFQTNEALDDEAYRRWKMQFMDENTGAENAFKPLLIEGGTVTSLMKQTDLDFINSRQFSRDEILAMWRVSPGILGSVENVNRANLEAGFYIHALINIVPRIRQFVKQVNATLVNVYDPDLELDFENPVPEDVEQKLKTATEGVDKWWTKDEVRNLYGDKPLPNGIGTQIIVAGKTPMTLESIVNGQTEPEDPENIEDPDHDGDDHVDEDPGDTDGEKSLHGVKKKP